MPDTKQEWHRFAGYRNEARTRVVWDAENGQELEYAELDPALRPERWVEGGRWGAQDHQPSFPYHNDAYGHEIADLSRPFRVAVPKASIATQDAPRPTPGTRDKPDSHQADDDDTTATLGSMESVQNHSEELVDSFGRPVSAGRGGRGAQAVEEMEMEALAAKALGYWRSPNGDWWVLNVATGKTAHVQASDVPDQAFKKGGLAPAGVGDRDWELHEGRKSLGRLELRDGAFRFSAYRPYAPPATTDIRLKKPGMKAEGFARSDGMARTGLKARL